MTPLVIQGAFHLFAAVTFYLMGIKLFLRYQTSQSQIAKYLSYLLLAAGVEYTTLTITIFFFPTNPTFIKILAGVITEMFFFAAICSAAIAVSYIHPRLPIKPVLAVLVLLGITNVVTTMLFFEPKGINEVGIVDLNFPSSAIIIDSLLMMGVLLPIAIAFIINTFKKKLYILGTELGIGLIIMTFFMPLTYQSKSADSFVFFTIIATIGIIFFTSGILLHPLLQNKQPTQN